MEKLQSETKITDTIRRVLAGETAAYKVIIEHYQNLAFTIAYRVVRNREDAQEIVQDAFVKTFRSLHLFRLEDSFSPWLYRIVYTTALTKTRKKRLATKDLNENIGTDITNYAENNVWDEILQKGKEKYIRLAMDQLSIEDDLILTLYYIQEQSTNEISRILSIDVSAVKVRLHRARKKLKDQLLLILNEESKNL